MDPRGVLESTEPRLNGYQGSPTSQRSLEMNGWYTRRRCAWGRLVRFPGGRLLPSHVHPVGRSVAPIALRSAAARPPPPARCVHPSHVRRTGASQEAHVMCPRSEHLAMQAGRGASCGPPGGHLARPSRIASAGRTFAGLRPGEAAEARNWAVQTPPRHRLSGKELQVRSATRPAELRTRSKCRGLRRWTSRTRGTPTTQLADGGARPPRASGSPAWPRLPRR